jgi:pyruvate formate lyase activating enzyme
MIGNIDSIDTLGLVDGPGIRVVVFLQGCNLRCKFCHNPETWNLKEKKKTYTPKELVDYILKYKDYFKDNGGVTFSGGEPLCQKEFLLECLKLCKKNDIHTCIDTAGYGDDYDEILNYADLILMDIKALDNTSYKWLTGKDIDKSLKFLNKCEEKHTKLWIRQVIIPGINDTEEYIFKLKEFLSNYHYIEKIELLPYHTMGITKYENLNIPYPLKDIKDMDKERCKYLESLLK